MLLGVRSVRDPSLCSVLLGDLLFFGFFDLVSYAGFARLEEFLTEISFPLQVRQAFSNFEDVLLSELRVPQRVNVFRNFCGAVFHLESRNILVEEVQGLKLGRTLLQLLLLTQTEGPGTKLLQRLRRVKPVARPRQVRLY